MADWSAPRVRGWSLASRRARREWPGVGPARAGVVRIFTALAGRLGRRPRACGGGPATAGAVHDSSMSAPRVRGWSAGCRAGDTDRTVGPARAGVVRATPSSTCGASGRPRACGGGPRVSICTAVSESSAPRVRGWSTATSPTRRRRGRHPVGPARAGVVLCGDVGYAVVQGRPRACGGGPRAFVACRVPAESAPRVRGWSSHRPDRPTHPHVGPARAGWSGAKACHVVVWSVGPARAGVVPSALPAAARVAGRPRVRGWSAADRLHPDRRGVGPAHAGWSSPRRRSERQPGVGPARAGVVLCALPLRRAFQVGPARAGVVRAGRPASSTVAGRPCACRGGPCSRTRPRALAVSAPRVRGWSAAEEVAELGRGVGPARAGMW